MTQIEERAKVLQDTLPCDEPKGLVYHAYVLGATEQRQIDIEKVYHALEKILSNEVLDNVRKILEEES